MDLFSPYADSLPGHKEKGGASEEAARVVRPHADDIRSKVLELLHNSDLGLTAPEVRDILKCELNTARSRLSELFADNKVIKVGRRPYKDAKVWPTIYRRAR